jgi:hypothetical protein
MKDVFSMNVPPPKSTARSSLDETIAEEP